MAKNKPKNSPVTDSTPNSPKNVAQTTPPPLETPISLGFAWTTQLIHKVIIFVFGCLLYANTLGFDHAVDDAIVITDNMHTQQGVAGIGGILGKDTFHGFFRDDKKLVEGGRYRPLSLVLFAVEMQLFGKEMKDKNGNTMKSPMSGDVMKGIAAIGHFGNMLLYGFTCILLYIVLLLLFKRNSAADSEIAKKAEILALVSSLIFVAHPIHTEAVANIKGCDEILSLIGSLGALWLTLTSFYKNDKVKLLLSGVVFFLGLLAKENAVTFLAIVPLAFYFFSNAKTSDILKHTAPLLIGFLCFMVMRMMAIGNQFGATPMELMNNPFVVLGEDRLYHPASFSEKYGTIVYTLGEYLKLLCYPATLTHDYYPRHVELMDFSNSKVLLAAATYVGLLAYAVYGTLKKQALAFAVLFYLLSLSIVSNVVFPVGTNMAERFLFMPSVGFALAVGLALTHFITQKNIIFGLTALICLAFSIKTITRNPVWYDNFTLFMADSETSVNSAKLQNACGGETQRIAMLTDRERLQWLAEATNREDLQLIRALPDSNARQQQLLELSLKHLNRTLQIHPTYGNAWLMVGNAQYYQRKYAEAVKAYRECLRLQTEVVNATRNLGCALRDLGRQQGELEHNAAAAETSLAEALKYLPEDEECYRLLGTAYGIQGKQAETIKTFEAWTQKRPNSGAAFANLAIAYRVGGEAAKAAAAQQRATQLGVIQK